MTRAMKEVIRKEARGDIAGVCRIAQLAGYTIECCDGDGESGMCAPIITITRKETTPTRASKSNSGTAAGGAHHENHTISGW